MIDTAKSFPANADATGNVDERGRRVPAGRPPVWQLMVPRISPAQAAVLSSDAWRHFVLVQVVPAHQVVARRFRRSGDAVFGAGLAVNEQDQLVAIKTGAVTIDHLGRVCLSNIQRSAGLDDHPKTIVVEGSVVIDGAVGPNWCIRASGDVEVRGFVNEAIIVAGGSVLVRGDVIGTGSSSMIVAGWDVMVNQAADTEILAGHNVAVAQQLLNCNVTAAGRILVGSPPMKSGIVSGGLVHAGRELALFRAGSTAVFPPELMIGPMPSVAGLDDNADDATRKRGLAEIQREVTDRLRRSEGPRTSNDLTQLRQAYRTLWGLWIRERELLQLSDGDPYRERVAVYGTLALGSLVTFGTKRVTVGHDITDPAQFVLQGDQIVTQRAVPLERPANVTPVRPSAQPGRERQGRRLAIKLPSSMVHELDLITVLDTEGVKDTWAVLSRLESELHVAEARGSLRRLLVKDPDTGVAQGHCYRRDDVAKIATAMGIRVAPNPKAARS
ncbi:MAG TPA: FapA family protein [Chloroflexota bacterium]|nr:FapA family protein [Chloroflexota bacterium]